MIPICKTIEVLTHPIQLKEDEYLDESGLIHCKKCRTPRQKRIEAAGKRIEPRCMCACQTADYEKRERERKHREFLDNVFNMKTLLPEILEDMDKYIRGAESFKTQLVKFQEKTRI